jgi:hypothetical protein
MPFGAWRMLLWIWCLGTLAAAPVSAQQSLLPVTEPSELPSLPFDPMPPVVPPTPQAPNSPAAVPAPDPLPAVVPVPETPSAEPKVPVFRSETEIVQQVGNESGHSSIYSTLRSAEELFRKGDMQAAAWNFNTFLEHHPTAGNADEVLYKLATAHILQGQPDKAKKLWDRLVREYFDSPWAQFVLHSHYDENAFKELVRERYQKARSSKAPQVAREAFHLLALEHKRFKKSDDKGERTYKGAVCLLIQGQDRQYREIMASLQDRMKAETWGKMAAIRLGGIDAIRDRMEELHQHNGHDGENFALFQDLANAYRDQLQA